MVDAASRDDELSPLPAATPGLYRHYKGDDYEVYAVVRHSETLEALVLYRPLYNATGLWVRPYAMFFGQVELNGCSVPRFELVRQGLLPDRPKPDF
jgi:hypothetical protein